MLRQEAPASPRSTLQAALVVLNTTLEQRQVQLGARAAQLGARLSAGAVGVAVASRELSGIHAEMQQVESQLRSINAFRHGPVFEPRQEPERLPQF